MIKKIKIILILLFFINLITFYLFSNVVYAIGFWSLQVPNNISLPLTYIQSYNQALSVEFPNNIVVSLSGLSTQGFSLSVTVTEFNAEGDILDFIPYTNSSIRTGAISSSTGNLINYQTSHFLDNYNAFTGILSESDPKIIWSAEEHLRQPGDWEMKPWIKLIIPAFQSMENYSATLTLTLV
ncbi:hypothetical protein A2335_02305 [Candidatus Peregrinibacteria bacterium RIFOXYB2_FULL_32_7]|nr:MAG: hypothetical protein A2335_02305 [Candidatus Peregrinibacteria bacterium RIFOXYB2_FULL_32_7]